MAQKHTLQDIRMKLDSHLGEKVRIRASEGRRRFFEKEGVLEKTYPSIFVVRFEEEDTRHMSWSYIDILTDTVELEFAEQSAGDR